MNVITYDVYKNTVKKHDGFNPVTSEKNYTKLQFRFRDDDDWSNCAVITASFWISIDNIVKSNVELLSDDMTATFDIPPEFSGVKGTVKVGLQGSYKKDNEDVTVATNIIALNRNDGVIVTEGTNAVLYEEIIALVNKFFNDDKKKIDSFISEVNYALSSKADKAITLGGYGITDAYTKTEVNTKLSDKLDNTKGSVTADNIASKAITSGKIATGAVTTDKIVDTAVTTDKIASYAVTSDKIALGAITSIKIAKGGVSGNNIAQYQINTDHLQDGAVTTDKLADEVNESINGKSDKSTTLAGYGITDGENIGNKVSAVDFQHLSETDYPNITALYDYHEKYVELCYDDLDNLEESKADKATTYTKQEVDTAFSEVSTTLSGKADKSATYTKTEIDNALSGKLDNVDGIVTDNKIATGAVTTVKIADTAVTTDKIASRAVTSDKIALGAITSTKIAAGAVSSSNIAENQVDTRNLANSAVTTEKLADDVKTLINSKYSGSNVETGTGNLTVYKQGAIDSELIKSCSFCYQKTGKLVNIFFNIVFNEGSIGYIQFTGLPFKGNTITNQIKTQTVTTMNNQVVFYPVNNWLTLNFSGTKTFTQDETLKGVITMQI